MLDLLSYPPIFRGLILIIISGFTFPLGGVLILRLNLLPIRYLLMHGVLLGGAISLSFSINPEITTLVTNIIIVLLLNRSSKTLKGDYGHLSMFFMVASVAAASIFMSVYHVPAKDTLTLLWGSLYTNSVSSVVMAGVIGLGVVLFTVIFFKHLTALFYNRDVATSLGIDVPKLELIVILLIALVVSSAMQLMGALLLDAQLILPVVISGIMAKGLKETIFLSSLIGGLFSVAGFFISLQFDIPVSAGVSIPSVLMLIILILIKKGIYFEKN